MRRCTAASNPGCGAVLQVVHVLEETFSTVQVPPPPPPGTLSLRRAGLGGQAICVKSQEASALVLFIIYEIVGESLSLSRLLCAV